MGLPRVPLGGLSEASVVLLEASEASLDPPGSPPGPVRSLPGPSWRPPKPCQHLPEAFPRLSQGPSGPSSRLPGPPQGNLGTLLGSFGLHGDINGFSRALPEAFQAFPLRRVYRGPSGRPFRRSKGPGASSALLANTLVLPRGLHDRPDSSWHFKRPPKAFLVAFWCLIGCWGIVSAGAFRSEATCYLCEGRAGGNEQDLGAP